MPIPDTNVEKSFSRSVGGKNPVSSLHRASSSSVVEAAAQSFLNQGHVDFLQSRALGLLLSFLLMMARGPSVLSRFSSRKE
jgi:hypothetical protein